MLTRTLFRAGLVSLVCVFMWGPNLIGANGKAYAQQTIQVVLKDGQIEPSTITVEVNATVNIRVVNRGTKAHNLVIPDFYIFTENLSPGRSASAGFSPDKTGSFPYYSDTGGSPEPGMRGQLHVR